MTADRATPAPGQPAVHRTPLLAAATVAAYLQLIGAPAIAQQPAPKAAEKAADKSPDKSQDAVAALQRGDLDQAILLYTAALDNAAVSNDRRAVLLTERGLALMKRRNHKAALDDFNKAAQIYPEYAPIYVNRGTLLLSLGQGPDIINEAIRDFDRAIVLSPALGAAYGNRGAAHLKLGASDAAIADFTRAIELQPQNPAALNGRGRAHLTANRTHAAIRDFTRAVSINPSFAQSYRNRAEARMRLGQPVEAAEDLSRALAFDARRADDYASRGVAYLAADNPAAALTDFTKAVELDAKSVDGHIGLGLAKARTDAAEDALNDLARAIELDPRSARAYAVRAWVYKKNQQPELGEKDVERALRLEPVKADAYWAQGELKEAAGDKEAAVAAYSRALGLDIRHAEALTALARLGLEPQRDETTLADAGRDGWRVVASGEQYTALNPQYPNLRVPLEMMSQAQPRILEWDRQKPPNVGFGLLRYAAGTLQTAQAAEPVEFTAVIDLATMTVLGVPVAKLGTRMATMSWAENRLAITGADGLAETIVLKQKPEPRDVAAAAPRRNDTVRNDGPFKPGGTSWPPWANNGQSGSAPPQREATRQSAPRNKPKSLFDLIFGN